MSHEIFDDLCAMHAFGSLDGEDLRLFEEHIASGCKLCEDHLREYKETMRALPYSNAAPRPSSALRERIAGIARVKEIHRFRLWMAVAAVFVALLGVYVAVQPQAPAPMVLTGYDIQCTSCQMKVYWSPRSKEIIVESTHVCPAPPGKTWQLWALVKGKAIPAGVFNSHPDGRLFARADLSQDIDRVDGFAVSVESKWEPQPTGEIVMKGTR
jgi:anti-sigma-K factor RskA